MGDLLEDVLGFIFCKFLCLLNLVIQITATCVLHYHHYVLFVFENFVEADNVRVPNFFQDVNLLENFFARVFVFELAELNHLDCYKLTCKFMHSQVDLSKCPITNLFDKLVKIKACWWEFLVFAHVLFVVFDNLISLLHNLLIKLLMLPLIQMLLPLMY